MPDFKLMKMFRSRSSSRHRTDSGSDQNQRRGSKTSAESMEQHSTESPEHRGIVSSSGYHGSKSSLSGNSYCGYGSRTNSLELVERRSQISSDGGISSMSGSGTDDSGHSSMSSPLNLPMEHLQSFNALYRGQQPYHDSAPGPYKLSSQGPPRNVHSSIHQPKSLANCQIHQGLAMSASNLSPRNRTKFDRYLDRKEKDLVFEVDSTHEKHFIKPQILTAADSGNYSAGIEEHDTSSDIDYPDIEATVFNGGTSYSSEHREAFIDCQVPSLVEPNSLPEAYRNDVIFELQWQVSELHERCAQLHKDADLAKDRLSASMHSVTTFWSPELKKERLLRKDEAVRCHKLYEQLKVKQAELKHQQDFVKDGNVADKAKRSAGLPFTDSRDNEAESESVLQDKQMPVKELCTLQNKVEDMEKQFEMQKQSVNARDASIKVLLDILQGKCMAERATKGEPSQRQTLQTQAIVNAYKISQLEAVLQAKDASIKKLMKANRFTDPMAPPTDHQTSSDCKHVMGSLIQAKDSQICSLEKEVSALEDKLLKSQESIIIDLGSEQSTHGPFDVGSKHMQYEWQKIKDELSHKDRKQSSLQGQTNMLQQEQTETEQHLCFLKEQLEYKDQQAAKLQTEVAGLQERLKTKDGTIERKRKEAQAVILDKERLESEVKELKDQLDSREHKVTVLKRKIDLQEELLKEQDDQLSQAKLRQIPKDSIESPVFSVEDIITERERQIERLRQLRDQSDRDHQEELELYVMTNQDLKTQMEAMHFELTAKQTDLRELRQEAADLRAQKILTAAKMTQLETAGLQRAAQPRKEQVGKGVQTEIIPTPEMWSSTDESLTGTLEWNMEPVSSGPSLLEELQKKVADMEGDKKEKENLIAEMQEIIAEYRQKVGTLKRNQQKEKVKNAQLLEEAKKREDSFTDDASHLSTTIEQKTERVGELEEALKESVRITAEREVDMMELQAQIEASKTAMEEMRTEVEDMRASSRDYTSKLATLTRQLQDKEAKIKRLSTQKDHHLQELYEIKQEAVQAAISEKDATLALLEMTHTKKPRHQEQIDHLTQEKGRLQGVLRDVTLNLLKLREGKKKTSGSTSNCTAAEAKASIGGGKKALKNGATTI